MSGYVRCGIHGKKQLGYVACIHVLERGAAVRYREDANSSDAGLILCQLCHERGAEATPMADLLTVCAQCLKDRGVG